MAIVPTEQLQTNAPPTISGGSVTPMKGGVADDILTMSAAQQKMGNDVFQIGEQIQRERDDAVVNEKFTDFSSFANEKSTQYQQLEGLDAVRKTGDDTDGSGITTTYDDYTSEINAYGNTILDSLENEDQKKIFKAKFQAQMGIVTNNMTTHSITQLAKYNKNERVKGIDNLVETTALSYKDFLDNSGSFVIGETSLEVKFEEHRIKSGWGVNSNQYHDFRNDKLALLNEHVLEAMQADKKYKEAMIYISRAREKNQMNNKQYNEYKKTIEEGYIAQTGKEIAIDLFNLDENSNSGEDKSSLNAIMVLSSTRTLDDGNGYAVAGGFSAGDGIDVVNAEEGDLRENYQTLKDQSKFFKEGSTVSLPPEHNTMYMFVMSKIGVDDADSVFTKAKSLAGGKDATNEDIIANVIKLTNEKVAAKFGAAEGNNYTQLIANDLVTLQGQIDYTWKDNDEETAQGEVRFDDYGIPLKTDLYKIAEANIKDKDLLKKVKENIDAMHTEKTENAEEDYNAKKEALFEKAFSKPNGHLEINEKDKAFLNKEDRKNLEAGFAEEDDYDLLIELIDNPSLLFIGDAKNPGFEQYRHRLTNKTFTTMYAQIKQGKLGGSGSNSGSGSTSVDMAVYKQKLQEYGYTKIFNQKSKEAKLDYIQIANAWKDQVEDAKKNGVNLDRQKKEQILESILANKVQLSGGISFGTGYGKEYVVAAVDKDQLGKTYTLVINPKDGLKTKVFHSKIPKEVRDYMLEGYERNGIRLSYQEMAERWVQLGMPKSKIDAEHAYNQSIGLYGKVDKR